MYQMNVQLEDNRADIGYKRALRKGFFNRIWKFFGSHKSTMLSYDALRNVVHIENQRDAGVQIVNINEIVGTVGRSDDFDRQFNPIREVTKNKWESVAHAYYTGKSLPPVELIKVGGMYFVVDGNHRISVMRLNGQDFVDAHVVELDTLEGVTTTGEYRALINCVN